MTVYITCDECGWPYTIDEFDDHECDDELDGYDPLEPWMDND